MKTWFVNQKHWPSRFAYLAALCVFASVVHAQSSGTGALTGTVSDQSGKSVPNATVALTNSGTNQERSTTTGADGVYKFSLLSPGTYRVRFAAAGFKSAEVSGVVIDVTETPLLDKVLEVGAVTQTVTVESNVETLQTQSSTLGTTVTGSNITSLPTSSRNYTEILTLSAGASASVNNASSFGKGTQDISVNGNDPGENNYQMDGVAINDVANSGSANDSGIYTGVAIPNPDAIAEFKIQTSTYDASYGRNAGGNVNVVTKSGTNNFHGTAFEFLRNTVLNANEFFFKQTELADGDPNKQAPLNQNQFGGTIGGPIKKDKLFFFGSYQGTRSKNGVDPVVGNTFGVNLPPIPNESRGTCPPGGGPISGCDTAAQTFAADLAEANCPANPANAGNSAFLPFIPAPFVTQLACNGSNLNPIALRMLQVAGPASSGGYYIPSNTAKGCSPEPSSSSLFGSGFTACSFVIPAIRNEDQGVGSLDYIVNSKNTLSARFFASVSPQITAGGQLPGYEGTATYNNVNALLKLTTVVSNNFVNELHASYQRLFTKEADTLPAGATTSNFGMTVIEPSVTQPPPLIMVQGNTTLFGGLEPFYSPVNQFQYGDQISWSHGKHTIRAGGEYEKTQWNLLFGGLERGLVLVGNWNDLFVGQPGNVVECLFCVKSFPGGIPHEYRLPNLNAYVQDDWKVNSRLTLNLGVRWEFDGSLSDAEGNSTNIWTSLLSTVANDQVPLSPTACGGAPCAASFVGNVVPRNSIPHYGQPPAGAIVANGNETISSHPPYSNFAPRFGFAWQPLSGNKLVVRGGVGIFYDRVGLNSFVHGLEQGNPYSATVDYGFPNSASLQSLFPQAQTVPIPGYQARYYDADCVAAGSCAFPTGGLFPNSPGSSFLSAPMLDQTIHTPLVQEYNLGIQYEFLHNWVLDLGYVGSTGINLVDYNHNFNTAQLIPTGGSITLNGSGGPVVITNNATASVTARVPFVGYQASGVQVTNFDGSSNYNSLQVTVRHQFSRGLSMQAAYTWSKSLTDLFGLSANSNNALDLGQQYGPSQYNHYNRFIVNYSYDLPFGEGMKGIAGKLASGWNVSGVTVAQSGDPLQIIDSRLGAAFGITAATSSGGYSRAELCPGATVGDILTKGPMLSKLNDYFNKAAFAPCGAGFADPDGVLGNTPLPLVPNNGGDITATAFGNVPPGAVLGPGQFNWDIALLKTTRLTEGITMQFRTETYNSFNHPQFADPIGSPGLGSNEANVNTANFGQITTTSVNPRIIQFALKFLF